MATNSRTDFLQHFDAVHGGNSVAIRAFRRSPIACCRQHSPLLDAANRLELLLGARTQADHVRRVRAQLLERRAHVFVDQRIHARFERVLFTRQLRAARLERVEAPAAHGLAGREANARRLETSAEHAGRGRLVRCNLGRGRRHTGARVERRCIETQCRMCWVSGGVRGNRGQRVQRCAMLRAWHMGRPTDMCRWLGELPGGRVLEQEERRNIPALSA